MGVDALTQEPAANAAGEATFPLAENAFPLAGITFPLAENTFPLAEITFPLAEIAFPLAETTSPHLRFGTCLLGARTKCSRIAFILLYNLISRAKI